MRPTESQSRIVGKRIEPFSGNKNKSIYDPVHIDELVHAVNALLNMQMADGQVIVSDTRVLLIPGKAQAPKSSQPIPCLYRSMQNDYLLCRPTNDGVNESGDPEKNTDIFVAKPPALRFSLVTETIEGIIFRYSAWDLAAQTRIASWMNDGSDPDGQVADNVEEQVIVNRYIATSLIYAEPARTFVNRLDGIGNPTNIPITLKDSNDDGRKWAKA